MNKQEQPQQERFQAKTALGNWIDVPEVMYNAALEKRIKPVEEEYELVSIGETTVKLIIPNYFMSKQDLVDAICATTVTNPDHQVEYFKRGFLRQVEWNPPGYIWNIEKFQYRDETEIQEIYNHLTLQNERSKINLE